MRDATSGCVPASSCALCSSSPDVVHRLKRCSDLVFSDSGREQTPVRVVPKLRMANCWSITPGRSRLPHLPHPKDLISSVMSLRGRAVVNGHGGRERGLTRGIRSQPDLIGQAALKLASPRAPIDAKKRVSRVAPRFSSVSNPSPGLSLSSPPFSSQPSPVRHEVPGASTS
jgi:hypothetical protein